MLKNLTAQVKNSPFIRNVAVLASGSMITSFIPIITAPINSRLYTPEQYGIWGSVTALASLLGIVAYSHFPQIMFLEKENNDIENIFNQSIHFVILFSILLLVIIAPVIIGLKYYYPSKSGLEYFYFLPILTLLSGFNATIGAWSNRKQFFKKIAFNRVLQNLTSIILQIGIGLIVGGVIGLCLSYVIGLLVSFVHYNQKAKNISSSLYRKLNLKGLVETFKKYKQLFLLSLSSDFINNFSNQLPVLMLMSHSTPANVGYYNMSNRLISLPVSFLTSSFSEVFRQRASDQYLETGDCRNLVIKTVTFLFAVTIIPFLLCMFFAPMLFKFFLGAQWEYAGVFARLIGILFFFKIVISPVSYVVFLAKKFTISLIMDVILVACSMATLYIGLTYFKSVEASLFLYAVNYSLLYFFTLYLSLKYAKKNDQASVRA